MPVSARSSVVLPWSIWPAVPTTRVMRRGRRRSASAPAARRLRAGRSADRARRVVLDAADDRRRAAPQRGERPSRRTGRRSARPTEGNVSPGSDPPPTVQRTSMISTRSSEAVAIRASARRRSCIERGRDHPPDRDVDRGSARPDTGRGSTATPAIVALSGRMARASGSRRIRATRSARPTMRPACGPPTSLSPLNVTMSEPAASRSCGIGSWARPKAAVSSSAPDPRSSMTIAPWRCASSATAAADRAPR